MIQSKDSLKAVISRIDTIYIDRIDPIYQDTYIKLLEKSNDQLSLVGNPLAWMIGALALLFTVGAIVSGILIYRQSVEFKIQQSKVIDSAQVEITRLQESLKEKSELLISRLEKSLENLENRISEVQLIDKEYFIEEIKDLKEDIDKAKKFDPQISDKWKAIFESKKIQEAINNQIEFLLKSQKYNGGSSSSGGGI